MRASAQRTSSDSKAGSDGGSPRPFGVWTLTFLIVASMIGAGAFTTSGFALADLGTPGRVLAAWIVGAVIALAGAAGYGHLARAMPESGGEYLFLSRAAHPMIGFVAGWVSLIAGFTGAIAYAATALESYVVPSGQRPDWLPQDAVAVGVVVLGGIVHGTRAHIGAMLQNAAVGLKLALLLIFLAIAVTRLPEGPAPLTAIGHTAPAGWQLVAAFATSLVWISLSYSGFNAAVYVAGESRDAARIVPRSLLLGTMIVVIMYVALNAVFVYGPPPDRVRGVADVAAVAADWLYGPRIAVATRAVIALALLTSVLGMIMSAPRVYAKMAEDGLMPRALRTGGAAPRLAIAAQVLLAAAFILLSSLRGLLSYLGLTLSLCAALSVSCLFLPSLRRGLSRSQRVPVAFYVLATVTTCTVLAVNDPHQTLGTLATVAAGAALYALVKRNRAAHTTPRPT